MDQIITAFEGRLAADPELEQTPDGTPVCEAVVLINHRVKQEGEWVDAEPTRRRIKAWRGTARRLGGLTKGTTVVVIGRVETTSWINGEGEKKWKETVVVESIGQGLLLPRDPSEHISMEG